ncbi:family 2 glycosyl transferase [Streptomyces tateyamensis]|uniref:Family 2 glycosyl transferase n=1 Tax=Streptomyces tateyamensis TaxID=565073 RepID=A0A2V4NG75_9ACTN|nr:glycosyltransferase family 2 protein [Streptomyces tateyamensis]PYC84041.1 family 2 glycosyl transferase [Streptomyces tateyamensis]
MPALPTLTVAVCAYTTRRWADLSAALDSLRCQEYEPAEVLLVVDHCPELGARAELAWPDVRVMANQERRGLSGARNTALAHARGEVIAFLDDDAVADPGWTGRLLAGYRDPAVLGVGGLVRPWWEGGRPAWFPPEFDWVVGCSYRGLPERPAPVRNFIGANMSFRRAELVAAGGFSPELGRIGSRPLGCEETELCLRLAAAHPGCELRYDPAAAVRHHVPPVRARWGYFRARCYAEGRSKATVARLAGAARALASERAYLRATLPLAVARALRPGRLRVALAICAGAGTTAFGYLAGRLADLGHGAPTGAGTAATAAEGAAAGSAAPAGGAPVPGSGAP